MSVHRNSPLLAWLTLVGALAVPLAAQTPPAQKPPAQTPTFRGGTEAVALDFLAIDAQGRPIGDLKATELKLTVDGKPRDIDSLKFIDLAPVEPVATKSALPLAKAVPAPFGSNVVRETGRTILVLVHHTSIEPGDERLVLDGITKMLHDLTPRDRVGVITFPQGEVVSDLTTDHERTRAALGSVSGHAPRSGDTNPAAADQTMRTVVRDLAAIIDGFGKIEGPKTVILVTQKMPGISTYGDGSNADDFVDLTKAASRVSAHFFVIVPHAFGGMDVSNHYASDPFGSGTNGAGLRSGTGVEDVTGAVGGELFSISGTADTAMARIMRESAAYYLLGFSTTSAEHNGKGHKIGLSTTRAGVTVLARPTFVIPKTESASKAKPVTPQALLADAYSHADLPLRGVAYAFRESASTDIKLLVAVEPVTPGTTIASAAFAVVDPKGKVAASWAADAADLTLRPIVSAMHVKPGTYRVRIAARDAGDHIGAVDYEFTAGLTKVGSIEAGALMTGVMRDNDFEPRFTFGSEVEAVAYTELYGADAAGAKVRFEIASTADGETLDSVDGEITPTQNTDRVIVTGRLPLITLPRGDIVVRAVITSGATTAPIIRTLRKR